MKYTVVLFAALGLVLGSCLPEENTKSENNYFRFTDEDQLKLVKPEIIGSSLKYKNQNGDVREFNITKCLTERDGVGSGAGMGFFTGPRTIYYHYDTQETIAEYSDENGHISLKVFFYTTPTTSDETTYPHKYSDPEFRGYLDFSIYNKGCTDTSSSCGFSHFLSSSTIPSLVIDGKDYRDVLVFNSFNPNIYPPEYDYYFYDKTVNKIYYSYDYFMIGFDEVDGTMWRIVN